MNRQPQNLTVPIVIAVSFAAATAIVLAVPEQPLERVQVATRPTPAPPSAEAPAPVEAPPVLEEPKADPLPDARPGVVWLTDPNEALRRSERRKKPVLVHLWSPTCGPCKVLKVTCFSDPMVVKVITALAVPLKVDLSSEANRAAIRDSLGVDGPLPMPSEMLVSAEGQALTELAPCPYDDPKAYLDHLKRLFR